MNATYSPLGTSTDVRAGQTVQVYGWGATSRCGSEINCQSRYLKVANVRVTTPQYSDYEGGVAVRATYGDGITAGRLGRPDVGRKAPTSDFVGGPA